MQGLACLHQAHHQHDHRHQQHHRQGSQAHHQVGHGAVAPACADLPAKEGEHKALALGLLCHLSQHQGGVPQLGELVALEGLLLHVVQVQPQLALLVHGIDNVVVGLLGVVGHQQGVLLAPQLHEGGGIALGNHQLLGQVHQGQLARGHGHRGHGLDLPGLLVVEIEACGMSLVASQIHGHQSAVLVHGGGKGLAVHLQLGGLKALGQGHVLGQLLRHRQLGVVGQGHHDIGHRSGGGLRGLGDLGSLGISAPGVAARIPTGIASGVSPRVAAAAGGPVDGDGVGLFAAVLRRDLDGDGVVAHAQPRVAPHRHLGLSIGSLGGHRHAGGGVGHRGAVAGGAGGEAGGQGAGADGQGAEVVIGRGGGLGVDGDHRVAHVHIHTLGIICSIGNIISCTVNRSFPRL